MSVKEDVFTPARDIGNLLQIKNVDFSQYIAKHSHNYKYKSVVNELLLLNLQYD